MEVEINIKHLICEMLRCWKSILIAGLIGAILLGGYSCVKTVKGGMTPGGLYAASGVLRIITDNADDQKENMSVIKDFAPENTNIIKSDAVLSKTIEALGESADGVSVEQLRENTYCSTSQYGEIVEVSVANNDEELSLAICEELLQAASRELGRYDKEMQIMQKATSRGTVTVEEWENPNDPRVTADIIKEQGSVAQTTGSVMKGAIKMALVGFVIGIFIWMFVVCVSFVLRGRVNYPEQLNDNIGIPLLGIVDKNR